MQFKELKKSSKNEKLLWLDMEMTGLDVSRERVIEVAALVTDWNFKVLGEYHSVVYQPADLLLQMDDWNKTHHGASGLLSKIPHGKKEDLVDLELEQFIYDHFETAAVLAGNSIGQDRTFIQKYFKRVERLLHYRMLDVTSFKLVFQNKFSMTFGKKETHRALDDIRESIDELKFYLGTIQKLGSS